MARRLAQFGVALVLLLFVLVGGAFACVLWFPDILKPPLERFLSAELGQPVEIRGPLRIRPGLVTTVEVEGVRIAAPEWARDPDLATLDRLRLGVDVGAYVRQRVIKITELTLEAPKLALERDAQGRTSWPQPKPKSEPQPSASSGSSPCPRSNRDGHRRSRRLSRRRHGGRRRCRCRDDAAERRRVRPERRRRRKVRGDPIQLTLQVKPTGPIAQPNMPLAIAGALSAAGSQLKVDGQLRDPATVTGLAVDIAVDSEDPRRCWPWPAGRSATRCRL